MLFGDIGLRDWLLIGQLCLNAAPWIALYIIFHQLRTHGKLLQLNTTSIRHQYFLSLTECMSDDLYGTMTLHLIDHFRPDVYNTRYKGNEIAIKSYLLMKRKYLYLLISFRFEQKFPVPEKGAVQIWIQELARFQEFHDVHESQKHYYKEFGTYVDELIRTAKVEGWMFDAHMLPAERAYPSGEKRGATDGSTSEPAQLPRPAGR